MKLIKITDDHYVIVDENAEIKEGDWVVTEENTVHQVDYVDAYTKINDWKKITHSTFSSVIDLYKPNTPLILNLSEVKNLLGEVDVEKKAEQVFPYKETRTDFATEECREIYKIGFNQAIEDNKEKKYTEEDMKVAITQAFLSGVERLEDFERVQEMILDNIKPKTEWDVEFDSQGKLKLKK